MLLFEKEFESDFEAVDVTVKEAIELLKNKVNNISQYTIFKINFMLREMLNNAVEHGNHFDKEKKVTCRIAFKYPKLVFFVQDEGQGIILCDDDNHCTVHDEAYLMIKENEKIELVKSLKGSFDTINVRNRGFETVKQMDFDISILNNSVTVTLNLSKEVQ